MCDCYWKKCEVCKTAVIPVHIADFCMSRDDVQVYCNKHLPKKDVIIHVLIEDESYVEETSLRKKKRIRYAGRRAGWKMGVRYLKRPPKEHGYTAVTPNVSCEYITKVITKRNKLYWTTQWLRKNYNSETKAVKETVERITPSSSAQQVWRMYLLKLERNGKGVDKEFQ